MPDFIASIAVHVLSDGFGRTLHPEERAADPLAGGMLLRGHQCGLLWGAALAAGAEAHQRFPDRDEAIGAAMESTRAIVSSFEARTGTVNCRDITRTDFSKKIEMAQYIAFKAWRCFRLASQWAPEGFEAAAKKLTPEHAQPAASCASIAAERMGASPREQVMVAGLAGGIGLSGAACGALGAAIWLGALEVTRARETKGAELMDSPRAKALVEGFLDSTGGKSSARTSADVASPRARSTRASCAKEAARADTLVQLHAKSDASMAETSSAGEST